jgi:hypothetical protein
VVVPHPEYVRFATFYGFKPDFCEAADPESKGMVENLAGYVQRDLLVPAELEQLSRQTAHHGGLTGSRVGTAPFCVTPFVRNLYTSRVPGVSGGLRIIGLA